MKAFSTFSLSKRLVFTALFAALCTVGTVVISIPLPFGYFNLGDVFVLLSAWLLGPLYGSIAAAVGSALADILLGFPVYAPATFLIKGIDALVAYTVASFLCKRIQKTLALGCSAVLGESLMVAGYFLFEWYLYGFSAGLATLGGNALQGIIAVTLSVTAYTLLKRISFIKKTFPSEL